MKTILNTIVSTNRLSWIDEKKVEALASLNIKIEDLSLDGAMRFVGGGSSSEGVRIIVASLQESIEALKQNERRAKNILKLEEQILILRSL